MLLTKSNNYAGRNLKNRQIELKARCNVSSINFIGKVWYYKHYDAIFFKDVEDRKRLIGQQLAKLSKTKTTNNESFLIECNYVKNSATETWISDYGNIDDFCSKMFPSEDDSIDISDDSHKHKLAKQEVYITSLSEGKWIKTNPRIWETNQTYYKIDETTQEIKAIIPSKDPIITGKVTARTGKVTATATKKTSDTQKIIPTDNKVDTFLDQHITAVMSTNSTISKKYLPTEETYQFNQIVQEENQTVPYLVVRGIKHNISFLKQIKELFANYFEKTFDIPVDLKYFCYRQIPVTSPLLHYPNEYAIVMYYIDPKLDLRFESLSHQKAWWKSLQQLIDSSFKFSHYRYFTKKGNMYEEKYYIDFDVYESHTSLPLFVGKHGQIVCPGTCYSKYHDNEEYNIRKPLKFITNNKYTTSPLVSFTQAHLEGVLKVAFPDITTDSFHQVIDNQVTFNRKNCIMEIVEENHICKESSGTLIFNTLFKKTPKTKDVACELRYKCECCPTNTGERIAHIYKTTNSNKQTQKRTPEQDSIFEPVTLDEELKFPDDMHFEDTVKNTDIGSAEVFEKLYKKRYVYNPKDDSFYYFKGDVWEQDKRPYVFTDSIIAGKLSSCMDEHISELNDELDRELNRQIQNKGTINKLNYRIKKCNDQRSRLTDGRSRVKTFIKTRIEDKNFGSRLQHPGKIAASNGFVDLKTGTINAFRPKDYVTKKCKYAYYKCSCEPGTCFDKDKNGNIKCNSIISNKLKQIDDIIREIQGCDVELPDGSLKYEERLYRHWMWCIGYGLSGAGNRKYLMYCHSPANSGKTLLLDAVIEVMGEYFGVIPKGALFGRKGSNGPSPELVMIKGIRGGFCDEVGKDDKIDDRNAKGLTGRSRMEFRGMCQEYESQKFKLVPFIAANMYVEISCLDPALWDRFMPVIFPMHFARSGVLKENKQGTERLRNDSLVDKFEEEEMKLAYFNWIIRACAYFYNNLEKNPPQEIKDKLKELKKESFALDEFIDQSDRYQFAKEETVNIKELYDEFKKFAQDNNITSKMGYSLPQFRNMIREMSKDDSYDRQIEIQEKGGRTAKALIKGIQFIGLNTNEYPEQNQYENLKRDTPDTTYTSSHYDPGQDKHKKHKKNTYDLSDDFNIINKK